MTPLHQVEDDGLYERQTARSATKLHNFVVDGRAPSSCRSGIFYVELVERACRFLLRLNPQNKTAYLNLVIGGNLCALFAWNLMAVDEGRIPSLRREPELSLLVAL